MAIESSSPSSFLNLDIFERADREFAQNLLLFAERIVLYRLTRVRDKAEELGLLVHLITFIVSSSKGVSDVSPEILKLGYLGTQQGESVNTAFSEVVDAVEKLDPEDLLEFVARLRKEPIREGI